MSMEPKKNNFWAGALKVGILLMAWLFVGWMFNLPYWILIGAPIAVYVGYDDFRKRKSGAKNP